MRLHPESVLGRDIAAVVVGGGIGGLAAATATQRGDSAGRQHDSGADFSDLAGPLKDLDRSAAAVVGGLLTSTNDITEALHQYVVERAPATGNLVLQSRTAAQKAASRPPDQSKETSAEVTR